MPPPAGAISFPPPISGPSLAERDFAAGVALSLQHGMHLSPVDVARVLGDAKLKYVIADAHAANAYVSRPRTTIDVDVIATQPERARNALTKAFASLSVQEFPVVIRLLFDGKEAVDIIRSVSSPLFAEAVAAATTVMINKQPVAIPRLEAVLAMKFASMTTLTRKVADRMVDAGDFARIVSDNPVIKIDELRRLAELAYAGGGELINQFVVDIRAGKPINI